MRTPKPPAAGIRGSRPGRGKTRQEAPARPRRLSRRLVAAYHEAGHVAVLYYARVGFLMPEGVWITSRGAGQTRAFLIAADRRQSEMLTYAMAGEAAECRLIGACCDVGRCQRLALDPRTYLGQRNDCAEAVELSGGSVDRLAASIAEANRIMALPEVWAKIEVLAACLLEAGQIDKFDGLIEALFGPLRDKGSTEPTTEGKA